MIKQWHLIVIIPLNPYVFYYLTETDATPALAGINIFVCIIMELISIGALLDDAFRNDINESLKK